MATCVLGNMCNKPDCPIHGKARVAVAAGPAKDRPVMVLGKGIVKADSMPRAPLDPAPRASVPHIEAQAGVGRSTRRLTPRELADGLWRTLLSGDEATRDFVEALTARGKQSPPHEQQKVTDTVDRFDHHIIQAIREHASPAGEDAPARKHKRH